ncbi:MAG: EAL domain-containing protein [Alphaproteobacteria bacterium]|nr:EAL domain-containing protein [Alphaproteobacteria bacterium]
MPSIANLVTGSRNRAATLDTDLRLVLLSVEQWHDAVAIASAGPRPEIVFVNQALVRLFGLDQSDILGLPLSFLGGVYASPAQISLLNEAVADGVEFHAEIEFQCQDGSVAPIDWRIQPIRNEAGELSHWVSIQRELGARQDVAICDRLVAEVNRLLLAGAPRPESYQYICDMLREELSCARVMMRLAAGGHAARDEEYQSGMTGGADTASPNLLMRQIERTGEMIEWTDGGAAGSDWAMELAEQGYTQVIAMPLGDRQGVCLLCRTEQESGDWPGRQQLWDLGKRLGRAVQVIETYEWDRLKAKALSAAANAVFITDETGCICWANEAFERLSGYRANELIGETPQLFKSGVHPDSYFASMWETLSRGDVWRDEGVNRRKNGTLYVIDQTITPVRGSDGETTFYVAVNDDITARKQVEKRVEHLANHDELTGLPNRSLFRDRLTQSIARTRRNSELMALMFIDLDRFKDVNDTLGHDAGDALLKMVGQRLTNSVRETDTVARLGGDEFAVIQTGLHNLDDVSILASRVIKNLAEPYVVSGHDIHSSASVGITLCPGDSSDPDDLLKNADMAMYRAKSTGRNSYEFFSREMNQAIQSKLNLERELRRAISEEGFEVHYQPQIDLTTGQIIGAEALVRWRHRERGLVSPMEFIPVAEETGLIVPLGNWVLKRACADAMDWRQRGLPALRVAVNASPQQFRDENLTAIVEDCLTETGLPANALELEITENVLMQNARAVTVNMGRLHKRGVSIAIDDFGTGYSSLTYLKRFVVDKMKIDRAFVNEIGVDPNDTAIVKAVISLARSLGITVIAEGVETEAQAEFLKEQGCHQAQGFHYGRPVPADQFIEHLENSCR